MLDSAFTQTKPRMHVNKYVIGLLFGWCESGIFHFIICFKGAVGMALILCPFGRIAIRWKYEQFAFRCARVRAYTQTIPSHTYSKPLLTKNLIINFVMAISSSLNLDGVYMDFLGFIPTMTHLFSEKKLNRRFAFLLDPSDYCSEYASGREVLIIHNVGQLRSLTDYEMREHHFWNNLFNKDAFLHFEAMEESRIFPYAPYIIKPNFNISLNLGMIHTRKKIEYSHLATEIRLFPQGATVVHIKVYFKTPLNVEDIVNLQFSLTKQRSFNLTKPTATKLGLKIRRGYSMLQLFSAIGKCISKSLYLGDAETIDKATQIVTHRIINPLGELDLTDFDVAAIMSLSKKPKTGQVTDSRENRVETVLETGTILAFGNGATLLYAPKIESKAVTCFRNNYSNVVEFALLQDFFLSAINGALNGNVLESRDLYSSECALAVNLSFLHYLQYLFGGHGRLFSLVSQRTGCDSKGRKLKEMSDIYGPASLIIKQMEEPQSILLTMMNNVDDEENFEGGILEKANISAVYSLGVGIKTGIESAVLQMRQQQLKMYPNHAVMQDLQAGILTQMDIYKTTYLVKYKKLVENLLENKEQIKKNADQKRQEGKAVPDEKSVQKLLKDATDMLNESKTAESGLKQTDPQTPKSFFDKAKPYLGAVVGAATAVLKALGYLPA